MAPYHYGSVYHDCRELLGTALHDCLDCTCGNAFLFSSECVDEAQCRGEHVREVVNNLCLFVGLTVLIVLDIRGASLLQRGKLAQNSKKGINVRVAFYVLQLVASILGFASQLLIVNHVVFANFHDLAISYNLLYQLKTTLRFASFFTIFLFWGAICDAVVPLSGKNFLGKMLRPFVLMVFVTLVVGLVDAYLRLGMENYIYPSLQIFVIIGFLVFGPKLVHALKKMPGVRKQQQLAIARITSLTFVGVAGQLVFLLMLFLFRNPWFDIIRASYFVVGLVWVICEDLLIIGIAFVLNYDKVFKGQTARFLHNATLNGSGPLSGSEISGTNNDSNFQSNGASASRMSNMASGAVEVSSV